MILLLSLSKTKYTGSRAAATKKGGALYHVRVLYCTAYHYYHVRAFEVTTSSPDNKFACLLILLGYFLQKIDPRKLIDGRTYIGKLYKNLLTFQLF
jgi:hypothetical protein